MYTYIYTYIYIYIYIYLHIYIYIYTYTVYIHISYIHVQINICRYISVSYIYIAYKRLAMRGIHIQVVIKNSLVDLARNSCENSFVFLHLGSDPKQPDQLDQTTYILYIYRCICFSQPFPLKHMELECSIFCLSGNCGGSSPLYISSCCKMV